MEASEEATLGPAAPRGPWRRKQGPQSGFQWRHWHFCKVYNA